MKSTYHDKMQAVSFLRCENGGFCMTIGTAMLGAFLLLLVAVTVVSAIAAIVWLLVYLAWLLVDHTGVFFSIVAAVLFVILTISFYVGRSAT